MEKKIKLRILGIILIIVIFAASAVVFAVNSEITLKSPEKNNQTSLEVANKEKKPIVLLFYSDWCAYCVKFMPKYDELSKIYKKEYNFVKVDAENPANYSLMQDYAVGSLPTLYISDPSVDNKIFINQTIYGDIERIKKELDRYLRVKALIK